MTLTSAATRHAVAHAYHELTDDVVAATGQTDKFVHINAGLLIWLLVSLIFSGPRRWWWGLLAVLTAEGANEVLDRIHVGNWNWPDTRGDMIATWAWPVILTLTFSLDRWRRQRETP